MCVCVRVPVNSRMEGVPMKMPEGASQEVKDVEFIVPDYLSILQDTEVRVRRFCLNVHSVCVHCMCVHCMCVCRM